MLDAKIQALKDAIKNNENLSDAQRKTLLDLACALDVELHTLESSQAHEIADHAHQAVQQPSSSHHHHRLQEAVRAFEVSHPNLTRVVQAVCAQFGV